MIGSVVIIVAAWLYAGCAINSTIEHGHVVSFTKHPIYIKIPLLATVGYILVKFVQKRPDILQLVAQIVWEFWSMLTMNPLFLIVLFFSVGMTVALWRLSVMSDEVVERVCGRIDRHRKLIFTILAVCFVGMSAQIFVEFFRQASLGACVQLVVVWAVIGVIAWRLSILDSKNPKMLRALLAAEDKLAGFWHTKKNRNLLKSNAWFRGLAGEEQEGVLERIWMITKILVNFDHLYGSFYEIVLPKMNAESLAQLEQNSRTLGRMSDRLLLQMLREVISGKEFGAAVRSAQSAIREQNKKKLENERTWKSFVRMMKVIFHPVVLAWRCVKKIAEVSGTLYGLYELFNKRCPYVVQRKVLKMR
jgi:hypothetical protein